MYLLHTLHHYLIERDWCWRRWRRLGNNGSTWWGLRRLTRMSANPCSWTWGWVCNDKATTFTNARLSSTSDICNLLLSCTCFCKQKPLLSCTIFLAKTQCHVKSCPGKVSSGWVWLVRTLWALHHPGHLPHEPSSFNIIVMIIPYHPSSSAVLCYISEISEI